MLKKILDFIKKVESDVIHSDKEFEEMSERNKKAIQEGRERMKAKQEEFDRKHRNR